MNKHTTVEWISTKDRLPEEDGYYITYDSIWKCIDILGFCKNCEEMNGYNLENKINIFYYDDDELGRADIDTITHWAYLPQKPDEKNA